MATLYKTNGDIVEVQPKNGFKFELKEVQEYVGGYAKPIYISDTHIMFVNEYALVIGLPVNDKATALLNTIKQQQQLPLRGDVFQCRNTNI